MPSRLTLYLLILLGIAVTVVLITLRSQSSWGFFGEDPDEPGPADALLQRMTPPHAAPADQTAESEGAEPEPETGRLRAPYPSGLPETAASSTS
jgi:hypothetical protein